MPQIDLTTYGELVSILYLNFWFYFIQVVISATWFFQWSSLSFLRPYAVLKPLSRLSALKG